jgi:hypothetical protein
VITGSKNGSSNATPAGKGNPDRRVFDFVPCRLLVQVRQAVAEFAILPLGSHVVHERLPHIKSMLLYGAPKSGKTMLAHVSTWMNRCALLEQRSGCKLLTLYGYVSSQLTDGRPVTVSNILGQPVCILWVRCLHHGAMPCHLVKVKICITSPLPPNHQYQTGFRSVIYIKMP